MRVIVSVGFLLLFPTLDRSAFAATLRVPEDFATIASACTNAVSGDSVVVACGTYYESGIIVKAGTSLIGEDPTIPCVTIDALGANSVIKTQYGVGQILVSGLRLINGVGMLGGGISGGGAPLRVDHCVFEDNRAGSSTGNWGLGGAISTYHEYGSLIVAHCQFRRNEALEGGAIGSYSETTEVRFSEFDANRAESGGAIWGRAMVADCTFTNQESSENGGALAGWEYDVFDCDFTFNSCLGSGAVLYSSGDDDSSVPSSQFTRCRFDSNQAGERGGVIAIQFVSNHVDLDNCELIANKATEGGAIWLKKSTLLCDGCVFSDNSATVSGGAVYSLESDVSLWSCTLVRNGAPAGGGLTYIGTYPQDRLMIFRSIISHSSPGNAVEIPPLSWIYFVQCTDVFGNAGGDWSGVLSQFRNEPGNIALDPLYCNFAQSDYGLRSESPCAEGNPAFCALIGAKPVECGTVSVQPMSWGSIKGLYR